jgi:hypothetical protein
MEVSQMGITRKEIEGFGMPATTMLARIVTGRGVGDLVEDAGGKKSLTVRLELEMFNKIEEYRKKAKTTRTAILEILIASGLDAIEKQIEVDGQMDLPVIEAGKPAKKKAVKK